VRFKPQLRDKQRLLVGCGVILLGLAYLITLSLTWIQQKDAR